VHFVSRVSNAFFITDNSQLLVDHALRRRIRVFILLYYTQYKSTYCFSLSRGQPTIPLPTQSTTTFTTHARLLTHTHTHTHTSHTCSHDSLSIRRHCLYIYNVHIYTGTHNDAVASPRTDAVYGDAYSALIIIFLYYIRMVSRRNDDRRARVRVRSELQQE